MKKIYLSILLLIFACGICPGQTDGLKYKLLATTKTSTMQKEMDEVSSQGYRILVGSPTSGSEMVLFLQYEGAEKEPYKYKLLATTRTGTMQKELNEVADQGYRLMPSTMLAKAQLLGGVEIVMVLERPPAPNKRYEYKLLATSRTGTLQKEVTEATEGGFKVVGMVSRGEHMVVMEREVDAKF
jgi:hypothetical protein